MNIIVEGKPVGRKKRLEKVGWRRNNGGSENKAVIDETEKQDLPYPGDFARGGSFPASFSRRSRNQFFISHTQVDLYASQP